VHAFGMNRTVNVVFTELLSSRRSQIGFSYPVRGGQNLSNERRVHARVGFKYEQVVGTVRDLYRINNVEWNVMRTGFIQTNGGVSKIADRLSVSIVNRRRREKEQNAGRAADACEIVRGIAIKPKSSYSGTRATVTGGGRVFYNGQHCAFTFTPSPFFFSHATDSVVARVTHVYAQTNPYVTLSITLSSS